MLSIAISLLFVANVVFSGSVADPDWLTESLCNQYSTWCASACDYYQCSWKSSSSGSSSSSGGSSSSDSGISGTSTASGTSYSGGITYTTYSYGSTEAQAMLDDHNAAREEFSSSLNDLTWDKFLAETSEAYSLVLAKKNGCSGGLTHDSDSNRKSGTSYSWVGENLAWAAGGTKTKDSWETGYKGWYDERLPGAAVTGHYDQIVRSSATTVGCGAAICTGPYTSSTGQVWTLSQIWYTCRYGH